MNKSYADIGIPLVECVNYKTNKYRVRFDLKILKVENNNVVEFFEEDIFHKPTLDDIKQVVLDGYNKLIDQKILSGFVWKDMQVWLSSENQFNYKAAYDLAVQTNGANLPIKFKFGSTEEPIYYTFESVGDLQDFYMSAMNFINTTLNEGWEKKDSIDWSVYEQEL